MAQDPKDLGDFFKGMGIQSTVGAVVFLVAALLIDAARILTNNVPSTERVLGDRLATILKNTAQQIKDEFTKESQRPGPRSGR